MFFGPLLFIGFIVLVVYLLSGRSNTKFGLGTLTREKTPLDILDERLARGDIDRHEYDEKRSVLKR
ncbi:MAG: SHOCT domain-containing protein [Hyphomicrobiaceae bacterium]|nr:SHOCT domain-containing protein [Hyphomicrobiaceae bacterium]